MSSGSGTGYGESDWRTRTGYTGSSIPPVEHVTLPANDRHTHAPEDTPEDTEDERAPRPRSRRKASSAGEFTGAPSPIQFRLPTDLITSMKLLCLQEGVTLSELALRLLTTSEVCPRVWVSRRNAG